MWWCVRESEVSQHRGGPGAGETPAQSHWPALFDRTRQQIARALQLARLVGRNALMETLFRFALPFGERAPRALDVGSRPPVTALEERDTGPHVDRLLVVSAKVVIETRQEQLFDARGAIGLAQRPRVGRFSTERLHADVIIGHELTLVNEFTLRVAFTALLA